MAQEDTIKTVPEMVKYIEEKYDRQGRYLVNGVPRHAAAAIELEKKYGLKDIAGHYQFVDGKTAPYAEYDYRKRFMKYFHATKMQKSANPIVKEAANIILQKAPNALKEINGEIKKLQEMNPELKRLNYNPSKMLEAYQALIGVTSGYNPDDINYFLHSLRTGKRDESLNARKEKLGIQLGWQPAHATMNRIETQLKEREKTKTATKIISKASYSR